MNVKLYNKQKVSIQQEKVQITVKKTSLTRNRMLALNPLSIGFEGETIMKSLLHRSAVKTGMMLLYRSGAVETTLSARRPNSTIKSFQYYPFITILSDALKLLRHSLRHSGDFGQTVQCIEIVETLTIFHKF